MFNSSTQWDASRGVPKNVINFDFSASMKRQFNNYNYGILVVNLFNL